uniref:Photosystem II reaction center protein Psb30 n=2 Tax=Euglena gracilis TaxID=3039 RepID=PSB30_EUGGR|nr:hypothetical protein EugrCp008 [Euglena gracilis]P31559.1 RecName: Full=Photosystem II reaction center protein Psb30; AltName: Full=Photosystem II reaction center protein Ycf12 [Euglena gracilis]AAB70510.1 ycf 12 [Chloroplast transformation vector pEZC2040.2]AKL82351.1 photosystem II reaction center protein [Euglena gracilis var. bacillaris]CAA50084.1 Ycf12 protein [Euglena gracilis]
MNSELLIQLGSLTLITLTGPLIIGIIFIRKGNL